MQSKPGLGRGLGALLSSTPTEGETLMQVRVDQVEANPHQPRKAFDSNALDELSASIRSSGLIQPVVVRRQGPGFQLIAGERRWRAARQAGLTQIPAIVREVTDAESLELALVENLLREDLNPMEEGEAFDRLLSQFAWTQEELAQRVGKDRSSISNALRLLRLPLPIQEDLRSGRLTMGHARPCSPSPPPPSSSSCATTSSPTTGRCARPRTVSARRQRVARDGPSSGAARPSSPPSRTRSSAI